MYILAFNLFIDCDMNLYSGDFEVEFTHLTMLTAKTGQLDFLLKA